MDYRDCRDIRAKGNARARAAGGCLVWRERMGYDRRGTRNMKGAGWIRSTMYI